MIRCERSFITVNLVGFNFSIYLIGVECWEHQSFIKWGYSFVHRKHWIGVFDSNEVYHSWIDTKLKRSVLIWAKNYNGIPFRLCSSVNFIWSILPISVLSNSQTFGPAWWSETLVGTVSKEVGSTHHFVLLTLQRRPCYTSSNFCNISRMSCQHLSCDWPTLSRSVQSH